LPKSTEGSGSEATAEIVFCNNLNYFPETATDTDLILQLELFSEVGERMVAKIKQPVPFGH